VNAAPWWLDRLCSFDIESTGVDVEQDRIVTAAAHMVGGNRPSEGNTWIADPGVDIPAEATKVHGISTEHARECGRPALEVVGEIVGVLARQLRDGVPIVAMNARFDLTILDREARRHGLEPLSELIGDAPLLVIDPYVIDKQVDRYRRGSRKLTALCEHYGVKLGDGAHEASADALAAARVAYKLAVRFPQLQVPLVELHAQQVRWAGQQAVSLQEYLRKSDATAVVEVAWPLVPFGGGS
jgi:DNA polymerase-3 subunit epsilon